MEPLRQKDPSRYRKPIPYTIVRSHLARARKKPDRPHQVPISLRKQLTWVFLLSLPLTLRTPSDSSPCPWHSSCDEKGLNKLGIVPSQFHLLESDTPARKPLL